MALASYLTFGLQLSTLQCASILCTIDRVVFLKLHSEHVILNFKPISGSPVLRMRPNSWGPALRPCCLSCCALSHTHTQASANGLQLLDPLLQTLFLALSPYSCCFVNLGTLTPTPSPGDVS